MIRSLVQQPAMVFGLDCEVIWRARAPALTALWLCRFEAIAAKRMHRSKSGMARCLDAMGEEMDAVTELITGKPDHFHDKGSSPTRT
jgi:hypothetical protein